MEPPGPLLRPDQNKRLEHLWVIEPQQNGHPRADAHAAQNRFVDAFITANAEHIVRHVLKRKRRARLVLERP